MDNMTMILETHSLCKNKVVVDGVENTIYQLNDYRHYEAVETKDGPKYHQVGNSVLQIQVNPLEMFVLKAGKREEHTLEQIRTLIDIYGERRPISELDPNILKAILSVEKTTHQASGTPTYFQFGLYPNFITGQEWLGISIMYENPRAVSQTFKRFNILYNYDSLVERALNKKPKEVS